MEYRWYCLKVSLTSLGMLQRLAELYVEWWNSASTANRCAVSPETTRTGPSTRIRVCMWTSVTPPSSSPSSSSSSLLLLLLLLLSLVTMTSPGDVSNVSEKPSELRFVYSVVDATFISVTSMSLLLIVGPKCTHAAPWWVTVSTPTEYTDRQREKQADGRTPDRYVTLLARRGQRDNGQHGRKLFEMIHQR